MNKAKVGRLYDKLAASMPAPTSELVFRAPFELLIAVVLSAQATDKSVNAVTPSLFPRYDSPAALLKMGERRLLLAIRSIGLAPTKARNIIATCKLLLERHQGRVPESRAALEELPGVGRKTANVVLNVAFGQPTIAVDTHVFRVANRTGLAPGGNVREVEEGLLARTPKRHGLYAHRYLILHGRYVCKARKPECPGCIVAKECEFEQKTTGAA